MDRPKLSTAVWLSIACVLWFTVSLAVYVKFGLETFFILAMIGVWIVLFVAAVVSWWYWMRYENNDLEMQRRHAESVTPMTDAANTIMRMSREQLDFLKMNGYYAIKGVLGTENGPIAVMLTPRGNIPWSAAERELRQSTVLGLRAIRETSDGSPEREWRRLFTAYCVDMGLAIPAEGPYTARWIDKNARAVLAGRLGIALFEYHENGNEEE